jgi:hypothetical protein
MQTDGQMERQTMMKLIVTFHNFMNLPKKCTPRMVYKKLPKKATYYRKVSQLKRVSTETDYYTEVEHAQIIQKWNMSILQYRRQP